MNKLKKDIKRLLLTLVLVLSFIPINGFAAGGQGEIKNVIFLIPDGMSINATTIARYMLDGNEDGSEKLYMDQYVKGLVATSWAQGPITDSAPAGTAYATGKKSLPGALGIDKNKKPRASLLEAAQSLDKSVGLIATSEFMHATPAAFAAHDEKRSNYLSIAKQMLNQDIDLILGTGSEKVDSKELDIIKEARSKGYGIVENMTQMQEIGETKIWGNFINSYGARDNMSYDIERDKKLEPSLSEMTKKAIELLDRNEKGFFLMVEGSKIDWAAHGNDTIGVLTEVLAFDRAFKEAVEFAKRDKNTLVVAVTDHGNSGISIGHRDLKSYDKIGFDMLKPLKEAKMTAEGAMRLLEKDKSNLNQVLEAYGINPKGYQPARLDSKDISEVNNAKVNSLINSFKNDANHENLVKILNQRAYIGYTTGGHTGEDVPVYVYSPKETSRYRLTGLNENTDVANFIASEMGVDLDKLTDDLFVDVTGDTRLKISEDRIELKDGKNILKINLNESLGSLNGKVIDLKGQLPVRVNGRIYLPRLALDLFNK